MFAVLHARTVIRAVLYSVQQYESRQTASTQSSGLSHRLATAVPVISEEPAPRVPGAAMTESAQSHQYEELR